MVQWGLTCTMMSAAVRFPQSSLASSISLARSISPTLYNVKGTVSTHTCAHTHARTHARTHTHTHAHMHAHTHTHACTFAVLFTLNQCMSLQGVVSPIHVYSCLFSSRSMRSLAFLRSGWGARLESGGGWTLMSWIMLSLSCEYATMSFTHPAMDLDLGTLQGKETGCKLSTRRTLHECVLHVTPTDHVLSPHQGLGFSRDHLLEPECLSTCQGSAKRRRPHHTKPLGCISSRGLWCQRVRTWTRWLSLSCDSRLSDAASYECRTCHKGCSPPTEEHIFNGNHILNRSTTVAEKLYAECFKMVVVVNGFLTLQSMEWGVCVGGGRLYLPCLANRCVGDRHPQWLPWHAQTPWSACGQSSSSCWGAESHGQSSPTCQRQHQSPCLPLSEGRRWRVNVRLTYMWPTTSPAHHADRVHTILHALPDIESSCHHGDYLSLEPPEW